MTESYPEASVALHAGRVLVSLTGRVREWGRGQGGAQRNPSLRRAPARRTVTSITKMGARNPKPYTGPHAMHLLV